MKNKMIRYPLVLGLIAFVATLLLATVHHVTEPIIEENRVRRENAVIIVMFGEDASIKDLGYTLTDTEKNVGIYSVMEVKDGGKTYYVYKISFNDLYDGDEFSYILTLNSQFKIQGINVLASDTWASGFAKDSFASKVKNKTVLTEADVKGFGATITGKSIASSVNAAIAHKGGK